ncbi:MAG: NAD(P)(+) transhydrogenase (Re/Si-specific) subunit beta, partial [Gemmatimonadales bacterium]
MTGATEGFSLAREAVTLVTYLVASVLFILGLKGLTKADTARRGMQYAAVGMLLAILGTLIKQEIVGYGWIAAGLVIGSIIGWPLGTQVPMTAMPQRVAISHMFGALAATLVGVAEYHSHMLSGETIARPIMAALGFEVLFGALTVTGSFVAFGKLQELKWVPGRPVTYKGQNLVNALVFASAVAMFLYLIWRPDAQTVFYAMVAIAFVIGASLVLPIGGGDMPVVISLLNSYAGLAASAMGFALENKLLIIVGALDGTSGFILAVIMCKAMNRSFSNVLFGGFGQLATGPAGKVEERPVRSMSAEEAAPILELASSVVIIPGYGMAVAQAQHRVAELYEHL